MIRFLKMTILLLALATPLIATTGTTSAVNIFNHTCDQYTANTTPDKPAPKVCPDIATQQHSSDNPIISIIKEAIRVISYVVGAAAIIGIVVSGIRMITANGDSSAVASARSGLIYSLIGVAVTILAQAIISYVFNKVYGS